VGGIIFLFSLWYYASGALREVSLADIWWDWAAL